MVLLDTGTPGTSREIYSEDADGETRTRNPWITRVRFWLQENSRLIAKASFSVMILKSAFLNSFLQLGHVLRGRQHHLVCQLNGHFG